jgi:hypothetical protein
MGSPVVTIDGASSTTSDGSHLECGRAWKGSEPLALLPSFRALGVGGSSTETSMPKSEASGVDGKDEDEALRLPFEMSEGQPEEFEKREGVRGRDAEDKEEVVAAVNVGSRKARSALEREELGAGEEGRLTLTADEELSPSCSGAARPSAE